MRTLIRTASGNEGGWNTETGHHESMAWWIPETEMIFFNAVISEVEDDNWWCCGGPFWLETTWLGCRVVIILQIYPDLENLTPAVLVKSNILKDTSMKWMKLGCVVPAFSLDPEHSQFWVGASQGRNITRLMEFEPKTFWPTVWHANCYATGADKHQFLTNWTRNQVENCCVYLLFKFHSYQI